MLDNEKGVLAAVAKITEGKKLYDQGMAELRKFLAGTGVSTEQLVEAKPKVATVAHKTITRRRTRLKKDVLNKVLAGVKAGRGWATTLSVAEASEISSYTVEKALETLRRSKRIEASWKRNNPQHKDPRVKNRMYRYWSVAE